jgi:LacI family gluconate utilization system Gnt-I transcriptional repressor
MTFKAKRPTLRDVAEVAGVSEMTVSRVLRGKGVVSQRTREHVTAVVEKMGYVQNHLAGSLASARSNQVAVIIPSLNNNVFTEVMAGITSELDKAGYNAVVGISDYDLKKEEMLVYSMLSWRPAGVVVPNIHHTDRALKILRNTEIPVVEMMNLTQQPIDISVGLDHKAASQVLADYLISRGYKRFGCIGGSPKDRSAAERVTTIKKRIRDHGLDVFAPDLFEEPPNFSGGKSGLSQLLELRRDLDAVFFSNDTAAMGGIIHCIEQGIVIPDDLAIAGFSGLAAAQNFPKKLTTIATKRFETGRMAARCIVNRLSNVVTKPVIDMGFQLIEGQTA